MVWLVVLVVLVVVVSKSVGSGWLGTVTWFMAVDGGAKVAGKGMA